MPILDVWEQVLLVEGQDDKHVVSHLRHSTGSIPEFDIVERGSVRNVLKAIPAEVRAPGRKTVGIMVDANDDQEARWQAVTERLGRVDVPFPSRVDPVGTIIGANNQIKRPRIGVWLMPDNVSPGELPVFPSLVSSVKKRSGGLRFTLGLPRVRNRGEWGRR